MKEKKKKEIGELIQALLKSFREMDPETLEKIPQLKKIKGHLVKVYPEKVRRPPAELAQVMYTVKYNVDYTIDYDVWDNYAVWA